ncbi:SprT-like domain-containing protein [Lacicoccus alkaliphilus]|uniref:SprT-like protein n=1 Tax=Lacicoccus alkaliphilus DSM 16010 TaxID=1123231 RepID=A0A1M7DU95_9BACL|nr:SprT-like domain-containing protein [Salinicoccus alkaliphilus]SHL83091.1 SprT-like protein [Salinicoccus alkaliphilus DSM 16010]
MNEKELEGHAKAFLRDNFNLSLDIPVRISRRMKSKLGVFTVKYYGGTVTGSEIVISESFILNNDRTAVLDVLHHECVHYALYRTGQPYRDTDVTFVRTLEKLSISRTRSYKYRGEAFLYECRKCRYRFSKNMKGYEKRYRCQRCRGKFLYIGIVHHQ